MSSEIRMQMIIKIQISFQCLLSIIIEKAHLRQEETDDIY